MLKQEEHIYEFGAFRLNVKAKLFLKENKPVPLNPKTFELLAMLVQRSGHLIEKEELLRELWPDSFVEESNLTQNIYLLRKALGEDANGDAYIKTVPRHGYRFMAEVSEVHEDLKEPLAETQSTQALAPVEAEKQEMTPPPRSSYLIDYEPLLELSPPVTSQMPGGRLRAGLITLLTALSLAVALAFFWNSSRRERRETTSTGKAIAVLPFKHLGAESQQEMLGLCACALFLEQEIGRRARACGRILSAGGRKRPGLRPRLRGAGGRLRPDRIFRLQAFALRRSPREG